MCYNYKFKKKLLVIQFKLVKSPNKYQQLNN